MKQRILLILICVLLTVSLVSTYVQLRRLQREKWMKLLWVEDKAALIEAIVALSNVDLSGHYAIPTQSRAVAIGAAQGHDIALILHESADHVPGEERFHLTLIDQSGRILDTFSLSISNRLTQGDPYADALCCDVAETQEDDGAKLIIRYDRTADRRLWNALQNSGGYKSFDFSYSIVYSGQEYELMCREGNLDGSHPARSEKPGLCRVAIKNHKFMFLYP
jgi:hypothetical protein